MTEPHVIGVDVSVHQGRLKDENWKRAAAAGVRFGWARVADGLTHLDDTFGENVQGMQNNGILAGGYLFFRASRDPLEQARLLVSQAGKLDLPPALDCEERSDMGLPRQVVQDRVRLCLAEVERLAGRVIVYTAIGWWEPWMGTHAVPYDLWVAHYGVERPRIPTGFLAQGWRFWQESPKGLIDGLPKSGVDLNRWEGTEEELRRYCGRSC